VIPVPIVTVNQLRGQRLPPNGNGSTYAGEKSAMLLCQLLTGIIFIALLDQSRLDQSRPLGKRNTTDHGGR
jgi:hypothetical protein